MSLIALTSASVGLNILLIFYIAYTRMMQLKRANEMLEEIKADLDTKRKVEGINAKTLHVLYSIAAEQRSLIEDEQIRTGKMDVPPLNGSGEKGRMSDES